MVIKKGIAIALVSIFYTAAFSQPFKKDLMISVDGYYGNDWEGWKHGAGFNASVSYFITSKLAVGITIPYFKGSRNSSAWGAREDITAIQVGPTLRYYFAMASRWRFYSQFDYALGRQTVDFADDTTRPTTYKSESSSIRLGAGALFVVDRRFSVNTLTSIFGVWGPSADSGITSLSIGCNFAL